MDKAQRSLVEWMPKRYARKVKTYVPVFKIKSAQAVMSDRDAWGNQRDEKIATITGWKLLGTGCSRQVWDMGNGFVVKLRLPHVGTDQNRAEVSTLKRYADTGVFIPLIAYDKENFDWLVTPKAQVTGKMDVLEAVFEKLSEIGLDIGMDDDDNNFDLHEENVGIFEGEPVVIDAGWF